LRLAQRLVCDIELPHGGDDRLATLAEEQSLPETIFTVRSWL